MSIIPQPSLGGKKLPISIDLAAASWGQYMAKRLVRFGEGRQGEAPSWEGRGGDITPGRAGVPITDKSYWEGRFALCELTLEKEDGEQLVLADAVAAVSRERHIVSTSIVGRNGTVKEYINERDWAVNLLIGIQAVDNGEIADEYPAEQIKEIMKYLNEQRSLRVYSAFLDIFGITHIVIRSVSITQTTEQNYQALSISAVSDEEYEIFSNEYGTT